jgi:hypothetical protein
MATVRQLIFELLWIPNIEKNLNKNNISICLSKKRFLAKKGWLLLILEMPLCFGNVP